MIELRREQLGRGDAIDRGRRPGRGCAGLIALLLLLAGGRDATAQEGVVLEVTTTTAEETFPLTAAIGAELGPGGLEALNSLLERAAAGLGVTSFGPEVAKVLREVGGELSGTAGPDLSIMNYEIYLRDNLMAVAAAGAPVMVWEVADSGGSKMWFLDPSTGRPLTIPGTTGAGVRLDRVEELAVDERALSEKLTPTGATREILGHTAHEHRYRLTLLRNMEPSATKGPALHIAVDIEGEAWVAPESPYREEIAKFYRGFAAGVGSASAKGSPESGHLGNLSAHMAKIAELGVPLVTTENVTTSLVRLDEDATPGVPLSKARSSSIVKKIGRAPIPDERYYGTGGEPEAKTAAGSAPAPADVSACDCSCEAYAKLQRLNRASKKEQESDPQAMSLAMCASQCAMKWIGCKR